MIGVAAAGSLVGIEADRLEGDDKFTSGLGAVLTGRRTFDVALGWEGNHAWDQHSY